MFNCVVQTFILRNYNFTLCYFVIMRVVIFVAVAVAVVCVFTVHNFGGDQRWAQQCVTGSLWFVFVAFFCGLRAFMALKIV